MMMILTIIVLMLTSEQDPETMAIAFLISCGIYGISLDGP